MNKTRGIEYYNGGENINKCYNARHNQQSMGGGIGFSKLLFINFLSKHSKFVLHLTEMFY